MLTKSISGHSGDDVVKKVKQRSQIENFPNIAHKHTKLIIGSQGTKQPITLYPYDAPFSSYRAKCESSCALFKFLGLLFIDINILNNIMYHPHTCTVHTDAIKNGNLLLT